MPDPYMLINVVLLVLLVIMAIGVVLARNLMTSTILLSIYSLVMAALYLVFGAPDVAITEAAIGAGISTLLFLAVLLLTGVDEKVSEHPVLPLLIIAFTAGALIYATMGMPSFGSADAVTNKYLITHYLDKSYDEIGIPNVVTSILASYRGFDTMGETFVVFTAAVSVLLLIGSKKKTG